MTTIIRVVGVLVIAVFCATGARPSEVAVSPLQLVGTADGREFHDFVVERGKILVRDGTTTSPLPVGIRWRLDGDLRAHADRMLLHPSYDILTCSVRPASRESRTHTYGSVQLGRRNPWNARKGTMVVFAWIVDGSAKWVEVRVVGPNDGPSADIAAFAALELEPEMTRGFPVVLAFDRGEFLVPEPTFKRDVLQRPLVGIYFDSADDFERDLAGIKSVNESAEIGGLTLLHFAAEAGNANAVRTLLTRGASDDSVNQYQITALSLAAANGRLEAVRTLLAADAEAGRNVVHHSERIWALRGGHVSVAMEFLNREERPTRTETVRDLLTAAILEADRATIAGLAASGGKNWAGNLAPGVLTEGVKWGDPMLTQLLLLGGMKGDSIEEGVPLLITAAKTGNAQSVGLLLQGGAKVDRAANDGTTALMGAVCSGNRATVEFVLGAGANPLAQDKRRQTAMDRASAMQRQDLVELLQTHGAPPPRNAAPVKDGKRTAPASDDCCCQFVGQPIYGAADVDVQPVAQVTPTPELIWESASTLERPGVTVTGNPRTGEISERQGPSPTGPPRSAPRTDHWGVATLVVEPDGTPSSIQVIRANPTAWSDDLEKVLQRYEFTPGQRNDQLVRTRMTIVVTVPQ